MPSDITGTNVFNVATSAFNLRRGPIFTDILLADEINRTPPKTQAALLESMEERQATIDGEVHLLSPIFTVLATENPIEYEGTYPLPEAQLDRFLLKIILDYPAEADELQIVANWDAGFNSRRLDQVDIIPLGEPDAISRCRLAVSSAHMEPGVQRYAVDIVRRTRNHPFIYYGASPRASVALFSLRQGARCNSWQRILDTRRRARHCPPGAASSFGITCRSRTRRRNSRRGDHGHPEGH